MESRDLPSNVNEFSLLFTDNEEIRSLNRQFRGKDAATDVLSFSQVEGLEPGETEVALGDVVVSLERAKEQAAEFSNTFEEEILRLAVHGILHLFGFDHENVPEEEVRRMQNAEDRLLADFPLEVGELLELPEQDC